MNKHNSSNMVTKNINNNYNNCGYNSNNKKNNFDNYKEKKKKTIINHLLDFKTRSKSLNGDLHLLALHWCLLFLLFFISIFNYYFVILHCFYFSFPQ